MTEKELRERAEQRLAEEFAKWYVPRRSSSAPEVVGWWREQALSREMENERLKAELRMMLGVVASPASFDLEQIARNIREALGE